MRRSRKKYSATAVSLFPFLAVLICTLGVLIVMLVMAAREAEVTADAARQATAEEVAQQSKQWQQAIDLEEIRAEAYQAGREKLVQRVADSRANRAHLRRELNRLAAELNEARIAAQLADELLAAPLPQSADDLPDVEPLKQQKAELTRQLAALETEIETLRQQQEQRGPEQFVIVPHKGNGGTYRRPIYVECLKDRLVLQPAGIELMLGEFAPPLQPGNMLDAALLTIRDYWDQHRLAGDQGQPYPLLVVRPEGAETFVLARRAMQSWNDEFGYELVSAEKSLNFGQPDARLVAQLRQAIAEARLRQEVWIAQRRQQRGNAGPPAGRSSSGGLVASSRQGGFVSARPGGASPAGAWSGGGQGQADDIPTNGDSLPDASAGNPSPRADATRERQLAFDSNQGQSEFRQSGSTGNAQRGGNGEANQGSSSDPLCLARQRGANWALPTQTPGATGYLRPIRVVCSPSELVLPGISGQPRRIPFQGGTETAIDPLVDEIWKLIDGWGIAGPNSYWKPQLRVEISPGGEQRFAELQRMLLDSGLVLQGGQP